MTKYYVSPRVCFELKGTYPISIFTHFWQKPKEQVRQGGKKKPNKQRSWTVPLTHHKQQIGKMGLTVLLKIDNEN